VGRLRAEALRVGSVTNWSIQSYGSCLQEDCPARKLSCRQPQAIADTIKSKALNVTRVGSLALLVDLALARVEGHGTSGGVSRYPACADDTEELIRRLRVSKLGLSADFDTWGLFSGISRHMPCRGRR